MAWTLKHGRFSLVVLLEALLEIIGQSHVALTLCRKTFNKIHVIQAEGLPSLKASEGVLPRANEPLQLWRNVHDHSKAGRQSREALSAKQAGWGGIRTPGAFRHTRFPGVHNQPLCHPSRCCRRTLQYRQYQANPP
jgi:hypothetical protein